VLTRHMDRHVSLTEKRTEWLLYITQTLTPKQIYIKKSAGV